MSRPVDPGHVAAEPGWGRLAGSWRRSSSPASARWPARKAARSLIVGVSAGALTARTVFRALAAADPPTWRRTNHRGAEVTLAAGPALIAGTVAGAVAACPAGGAADLRAVLLAVSSAALAGGYDDAYGSAEERGLRGHLSALGSGAVTTGAVKIAGIGTGAVWAARCTGRSAHGRLVAAGLIAGSANLANLLDLRPGRLAKVAVLAGVPLLAHPAGWPAAGAVGAATALLPVDLAERGMLGDSGANALGAALGTALALRGGRRAGAPILAVIGALTLASERVSFTTVIERTPALRWFDRLGRIG